MKQVYDLKTSVILILTHVFAIILPYILMFVIPENSNVIFISNLHICESKFLFNLYKGKLN